MKAGIEKCQLAPLTHTRAHTPTHTAKRSREAVLQCRQSCQIFPQLYASSQAWLKEGTSPFILVLFKAKDRECFPPPQSCARLVMIIWQHCFQGGREREARPRRA